MDEIAVAPGVMRRQYFWGVSLEGTKDALLLADLVKPEWFLDGREKTKYGKIVRTVYMEQDGIPVECTQPARGLCTVRFLNAKYERDPVSLLRFGRHPLMLCSGRGIPLVRQEMARIAAEDNEFQRFIQRVINQEGALQSKAFSEQNPKPVKNL